MRAFVNKSAAFLSAMMLFAAIGAAQPAATNGSSTASVAASRPAAVKMPFVAGETLTYEGKLSKIISGIPVADLVLSVKESAEPGSMVIEAEARSKGTLLKLFRFSFLQQVSSTVDGRDLFAVRTVKHDVQKERVRDSEAAFNYSEGRVTYTETDPKEPMRPPRKIASEISGATHDILSGIYILRTLPLVVGKTFDLSVSDSGLVYTIPVKVAAREQQKTAIGKVWCFRLEPEVFGPNRFIEQEGHMTIWITDDAKRIPVRSVVKSNVGKLDIRLRSAVTIEPKPSSKTAASVK
ncbi:MAG: DUF3108 domain-containing protein [Pyrinomonadaceae bacterium]|nr:DUF3108 domain-containing protein [Pyrinomonadaceae bacterium]